MPLLGRRSLPTGLRDRFSRWRIREATRRVLAFGEDHPWPCLVAVVTGLALGVAVGLPAARGLVSPLVLMLLATAALALLVRAVVPAEDRVSVTRVLGLGLGIRFAAAAILYFWAEAHGRMALTSTVPLYYVVGDDANYADLSWAIVKWLGGDPDPRMVPPSWRGEAYLIGTFVYLEVFIFAVFGPIVLNVQVVNAAIGAAMLVFLYDIARRLGGSRPALLTLAVLAVFPSLVLWSALNLKDALAGLLIALALWLFLRLQLRPRWTLLLAVFLVLIPIETIRRYVYFGLALLFPIAVALAAGLSRMRRVGMAAAASLLAFLLLSMGSGEGQGTYGVPTGFATFEAIRQGMGHGARTTFAEPRAVTVNEGEVFLVVNIDAPPGATPEPLPPPGSAPRTPCAGVAPGRTLTIEPGTRVFIANPRIPDRTAPAGYAVVCAGDIIVVGPPGTTPVPNAVKRNLDLKPSLESANTAEVHVATGSPETLTLTRTLSYLPKGAMYALFAPFPWQVGRALDLLTIPEMLFWYVTLAAIPWSLWRFRDQWRLVTPIALYVLGMIGVFILTEGNFGTLFRHRAMVTPFAVAIAAPGLIAVADLVRSRWPPRMR